MCDEGRPQDHSVSAGSSRRDFLKVSAATGAVAAAGLSLFDPPPAAGQNAAPPKWKGRLLNVNLRKLREELEASRDDIFQAAGVPQDLFRLN